MADRAVGREAGRHVVGIRRPGEIRLMAGVAGRRRRCVVIVGVALGAGQRGMSASQRIVGIERVIEVTVVQSVVVWQVSQVVGKPAAT